MIASEPSASHLVYWFLPQLQKSLFVILFLRHRMNISVFLLLLRSGSLELSFTVTQLNNVLL